MQKKILGRPALILIALALVVGFGWVFWQHTAEHRNAERIISAVETFRKTHGRLPDASNHTVMKKLGFELRVGWHPDYQMGQIGQYCLTILKGFDGPYWIYDSGSQRWCQGYPTTTGTACARCSKS